jgi:peptidoglycan/xylan/chitin deacetylase (PgdA/CDA1 family)
MLRTLATGAAAAGLVVGGFHYAALWPESQFFGRSLLAGADPAEVALTYDDGPNERCTLPLLDTLARHNARATFFLIGRYARQEPSIARAIHAAGHRVGSHTFSHPRLMYASERAMRAEIADGLAAVQDVLGAPVVFFRPPFGGRRPVLFRILRELGQIAVMWNASSYDWRPGAADEVLLRVERAIARNQRRGRGSNVLMHDGGHLAMGADRRRTVEATSRLLQRTDLRFVTLDAWVKPEARSLRFKPADAARPKPGAPPSAEP